MVTLATSRRLLPSHYGCLHVRWERRGIDIQMRNQEMSGIAVSNRSVGPANVDISRNGRPRRA